MKFRIQKNWNTQQLLVRNIAKEDIPNLQKILRVLHTDSNWEEISLENYDKFYFENIFKNPSIPPGGNSELTHNQVIIDQESNAIIGWIEFYYGYPSSDIIWIGSLFFDPIRRAKGFGKEVMTVLINQLKENQHYQSIQLGVYLRNWGALNFWFHLGFNKIIKFTGDRDYSEKNNGKVCLELQL
jgi:ribosomal protein S18 acetylase RimI-like enzyme